MLVVLVLFILVFTIVSVQCTLEELLLVNSHLRSRWQVLLSTSWRLFLLHASVSILSLFLTWRMGWLALFLLFDLALQILWNVVTYSESICVLLLNTLLLLKKLGNVLIACSRTDLMVHLWVNSPYILKIFIKLDLRLVNPSGESVFLILQVFEELAISWISGTFLVSWLFGNFAPPWMFFNFFPIYSVDGVLFQHQLYNIIEFIWESSNSGNFLNHYLLDEIF